MKKEKWACMCLNELLLHIHIGYVVRFPLIRFVVFEYGYDDISFRTLQMLDDKIIRVANETAERSL